MDVMKESRKTFDWLAFLVRIIVVAALATWMLIERLHRQDRKGAALVIGFGYVILPALAYLHTRYYNTKFITGVIESVRRHATRKHNG